MNHLGTTVIDVKLEGIDQPIPFHEWNHPLLKGQNHKEFIAEYESAKRNNLVRPGATVIDIGAFTGDSSLAYGLLAGKKGEILAFEPNPYAFKVLHLNSGSNNFHPFECAYISAFPWGISDKKETKTFGFCDFQFLNGGDPSKMGDIHGPAHCHNLTVECIPLSIIAKKLKRIDLIKIDAEGSDADILESISGIVKKFKPILKMEMYPGLTYDQRMKFYQLVRSLGYLPYDEDSGSVIHDISFVMPGRLFNFICRPI